jgi:hypothetical protein
MTSPSSRAYAVALNFHNGNRKAAAAALLAEPTRVAVASVALRLGAYLDPDERRTLGVLLDASDDPEPAPTWARDAAVAILDDLAASNSRDVPTGIDFCEVMALLERLADR